MNIHDYKRPVLQRSVHHKTGSQAHCVGVVFPYGENQSKGPRRTHSTHPDFDRSRQQIDHSHPTLSIPPRGLAIR